MLCVKCLYDGAEDVAWICSVLALGDVECQSLFEFG